MNTPKTNYTPKEEKSLPKWAKILVLLIILTGLVYVIDKTVKFHNKICNSNIIIRRSEIGRVVSSKTSISSFGYPITTTIYEKGIIVSKRESLIVSKQDIFELVYYKNEITNDITTVLHRIGDPDTFENIIE